MRGSSRPMSWGASPSLLAGRRHPRSDISGFAMVLAVLAFPPAHAGSAEPNPPSVTPGNAAKSAAPPRVQSAGARLLAAYPEHVSAIDGNDLIWKDGTRMPIDDGQGPKPFDTWLERPDLEDMLQRPYPAGAPASAPGIEDDPGRARNAAFFDKMYGDCRKDEVSPRLVDVVWLPTKSGKKLKVTAVNGVAEKLDAVSRALDALPHQFTDFLTPTAGTYICRVIAGTGRVSAHGHGIAIDISVKHSDYWRWAGSDTGGRPVYRNRIPKEIVDIFEAHGFIWGGRWYHYDTMHFEYRPEILPESRPPPRP